MSHWNHRVMRLKHDWADEEHFSIREVYYDEEGAPDGYTNGDVVDVLESDSLDDLRLTLQRMTEALDKPVLTPADMKGKA